MLHVCIHVIALYSEWCAVGSTDSTTYASTPTLYLHSGYISKEQRSPVIYVLLHMYVYTLHVYVCPCTCACIIDQPHRELTVHWSTCIAVCPSSRTSRLSLLGLHLALLKAGSPYTTSIPPTRTLCVCGCAVVIEVMCACVVYIVWADVQVWRGQERDVEGEVEGRWKPEVAVKWFKVINLIELKSAKMKIITHPDSTIQCMGLWPRLYCSERTLSRWWWFEGEGRIERIRYQDLLWSSVFMWLGVT